MALVQELRGKVGAARAAELGGLQRRVTELQQAAGQDKELASQLQVRASAAVHVCQERASTNQPKYRLLSKDFVMNCQQRSKSVTSCARRTSKCRANSRRSPRLTLVRRGCVV